MFQHFGLKLYHCLRDRHGSQVSCVTFDTTRPEQRKQAGCVIFKKKHTLGCWNLPQFYPLQLVFFGVVGMNGWLTGWLAIWFCLSDDLFFRLVCMPSPSPRHHHRHRRRRRRSYSSRHEIVILLKVSNNI